MSKFLSFTAVQYSILTKAFQLNASSLDRKWRELLVNADLEQLRELLAEFESEKRELLRQIDTLPPVERLQYFIAKSESVIGSSFQSSTEKRAFYLDHDGLTKNVDPIGDIEQYLSNAIQGLKQTVRVLDKIVKDCRKLISEKEEELRDPARGKEHLPPYKQILALPAPIDAKQKKAFADTLDNKKGNIDLRPLNKTNAATIVVVVLESMRKAGTVLSNDELAKLKIWCKNGRTGETEVFPVYRKRIKDKKPRNEAKHFAVREFGMLDEKIRKWKDDQEPT